MYSQRARRSKSEIVRNLPIPLPGNLRRGDAQAKETGIDIHEGFFDRREIQIIVVDEYTKFFVGEAQRTPGNCANLFNGRRGKARPENTAARGTTRPKDENIYSTFLLSLTRNGLCYF